MKDERRYTTVAKVFAESIRELAANPENLDNLESYLSIHFGEWLKKYANTPIDITQELKSFANMQI